MQTTLIYNQKAGSSMQPGPDEILEVLRQIGFHPVYHPTESEEDLNLVLADAKDLVVVAGGDGSVRAVAIRLLGKNIKITPLPMGTANNIARTLSLTSPPLEILSGLSDPVARAMDIGRVSSSEKSYYFLEAMGIGVFADGMKRYNPENGKSVLRSIQSAMETLTEYRPKFFHLNLDGQDLSGSYVLVEVMNTPTLGLRYKLAPDAVPDDGLFDLVMIHASQRENYLRFVAGVITENLDDYPSVSVERGSQLQIAWRGFPLHLDGEVLDRFPWNDEGDSQEAIGFSPDEVAGPYLKVELLQNAIHFLVPRASQTKENA